MPGAGESVFGVIWIVGALIVASVPIYKLIGWWAEGATEPALAFFGILLYLALIAGVMGAPSVFKVIIIGLLVVSAVLTPLFGQVSDKIQNTRIEDQRVDSYARALDENPMNHVARIALAEALYKKGQLDQAIEHLSWTLQQSPALSFRIRPQIESWTRERERIGVAQPIYCHMCQAENMPGSTQCEKCGAMFGVRSGMEQRVWQQGGPKVVLRGWIVTSTIVIVALFLFIELPSPLAGALTLAMTIVGAWLFLRWVGGDMGVVPE